MINTWRWQADRRSELQGRHKQTTSMKKECSRKESDMDASQLNRPKSSNEMINRRGSRLHFRIDVEEGIKLKCACFWIHGYGGHVNRPETTEMTHNLNQQGYAVISLDLEGHGYSDGERALILSHTNLVDDMNQFIQAIEIDSIDNPDYPLSFENSIGSNLLPTIRRLPFFLMGQSMGGAVTALVSPKLTSLPNYIGSILLAPYLGGASVPHWSLVEILRYTFVSWTPNSQMPSWLFSFDNRSTWKDEQHLAFAEMDTWGQPGAVGYNQPMKWGTAAAFIDLGLCLQSSFHTFSYPFLIIHDPGDAVVPIQGSKDMMVHSPSSDKQLIEVPGYLHGLLCNHPDEICNLALTWVETRLKTRTPST